ncbi:hypothetical protein TSAR_007284 [Trichomalopsis sarcophagae]|uniref:Uncharacterized protein n=1 Tax=Trichomalopsis sarcophagae TaxID=543379 RepID=A0A232ELU9_9HYME|nr:hypothetical protein TSAR_007284 [Trichomalopsis sarcophagae]
MPVPISQTLTLTSTLVPKEESTMPFIDDELLWCPDNDGKMVDLTQCLQGATGRSGRGQPAHVHHFLGEFLQEAEVQYRRSESPTRRYDAYYEGFKD